MLLSVITLFLVKYRERENKQHIELVSDTIHSANAFLQVVQCHQHAHFYLLS